MAFCTMKLVFVLAILPLVLCHSFMTEPPPYNQVFLTKSCQGAECSQACPNLKSSMPNSPENPAVVWRRGETVNVKWAKNNHRGGLVYMSIVPVDVMMSKSWQTRLAIWWGCWESGMYSCSGSLCGSDTNGEGFKRDVTIPTVYPDGIYVAAIVWVGGLHFSREKGQFADYHSCSFVEIRGGPLESSYQPFWEPGDTGEYQNGEFCQTAADDIEQCPKTGCTGPSFWGVAKPFKNGNKPDKITPRVVASAFNEKPQFEVSEDGDGQRNEPRSTPPPTTMTTAPPTTASVASQGDDDQDEGDNGGGGSNGNGEGMICAGKVCCPSSCGACGGSGCNTRPGGSENCCFTYVQGNGRICGRDSPPCNKL